MGRGSSSPEIEEIKMELAGMTMPNPSPLCWDGLAGVQSLTAAKNGEVTTSDGKVLLSVTNKSCDEITFTDVTTGKVT